jgi:hypothetical protein
VYITNACFNTAEFWWFSVGKAMGKDEAEVTGCCDGMIEGGCVFGLTHCGAVYVCKLPAGMLGPLAEVKGMAVVLFWL